MAVVGFQADGTALVKRVKQRLEVSWRFTCWLVCGWVTGRDHDASEGRMEEESSNRNLLVVSAVLEMRDELGVDSSSTLLWLAASRILSFYVVRTRHIHLQR